MLVAVKNSVAIVGKGEGWREAPDGGEVWGVNDVVLRRDVALVFDMHDLRNVREWTAGELYWVLRAFYGASRKDYGF